jgi:hypothetical protein
MQIKQNEVLLSLRSYFKMPPIQAQTSKKRGPPKHTLTDTTINYSLMKMGVAYRN